MSDFPPEAVEAGKVAFREARDEGCRCDPEIELSPGTTPSGWFALVRHDEWCPLLARLRAYGAPLPPPSAN